MQRNSLDKIESVLRLDHAVFDELSFSREGFRKEGDFGFKIHVNSAVSKQADGEYRVSLLVAVQREGEYTVSARISGFFSIDENNEERDVLLKRNALAILFPYVRSELTLLTSQPETTPVVLPALNINTLIDKFGGDHSAEVSDDG